MPGKTSQTAHAVASSKLAQSGPYAGAFKEHFSQIIASPAFKGSRRSQEFLQYIVDKALQGQLDALKERVLGVELFGRPATYDTSEDAIVRVTASDLRRRLHQFYANAEPDFPLRIELPAGSYQPEFRWIERRPVPLEVVSATPVEVPNEFIAPQKPPLWRVPRVALYAVLVALLATAGYMWGDRVVASRQTAANFHPWASILNAKLEPRIVFCDPEISLIQHLVHFQITLSDYANRRYLPATATLTPEMQAAVDAMRGTKVAYADSTIALNIAELAASAGRKVRTHPARQLQLLDFKTDDNFILLGSPRSNPWFGLFEEKLDFRFEYDASTGQEIIVNKHPARGELARYLPTAKGGGTGQAYAVVAFLPNPGQRGNVMLLAGSNAEATEAAGNLATNVEALSRTLREHAFDPAKPNQPFEILLRVATMAGSPNTYEVVACHKLKA
ncbi:MAG: hypothetical protein HYX27_00295 [Acidobacteria bacterium]|nr:hypothetical protein [Acidobacteriota bacterium]